MRERQDRIVVTVNMERQTDTWLRAESERSGLSRSEIINVALTAYIAAQPVGATGREPTDAFVQAFVKPQEV